jgi:hypothetical protein
VDHAQQQGMSERWACRVVKQPRGTQRQSNWYKTSVRPNAPAEMAIAT